MTPKDRVKKTFRYQKTDRVPVWCGASPEFIKKAIKYLNVKDAESVYQIFGDDFRRVSACYAGPKEHSSDFNLPMGSTFRSPFGIARHGFGYGQPIDHPLAGKGIKEVKDYLWPDPSWMSATNIKKDVSIYNGEFAILGGAWSPFWHDAIDMMGMEQLLLYMYDEPETVDSLMSHIVDYYYGVNKIIFEEAEGLIDIFFMGNDLGTQNGPILSKSLFERFLMPHIQKMSSQAHYYGIKVMMHCCGGFEPLIPSLINAGVDALQALQPTAKGMDPYSLKRKYGGKIVLNGCIDSHHILINGTPEIIREKTREVLDIMTPGGGFILSPSHDYLLEETPVENALAMYETALKGYAT